MCSKIFLECIIAPSFSVAALEKLGAELFLQVADRIGNGGLRHAEFTAGCRETGQPPSRLEDDEVAGRGQEVAKALHKQNLYK